MSAYILVCGKITDPERFKPYAIAAAELVAQKGGVYLVRGGATQALEGAWDPENKLVISKWPDRQTALDFWNSPEYREVSAMRKGAGEFTVTLVDGAD